MECPKRAVGHRTWVILMQLGLSAVDGGCYIRILQFLCGPWRLWTAYSSVWMFRTRRTLLKIALAYSALHHAACPKYSQDTLCVLTSRALFLLPCASICVGWRDVDNIQRKGRPQGPCPPSPFCIGDNMASVKRRVFTQVSSCVP